MDDASTTAICDALHERARLARSPLMRGHGVLEGPSGKVEGFAEFLLPIEGHPVAALCSPHAAWLGMLTLNRLVVSGDSIDGPFEMTCSPWGTDGAVVSCDGSRWALIRSLNQPMIVRYSAGQAPSLVRVLLNNFNYERGNPPPDEPSNIVGRRGSPLIVQPGGRAVTFAWTSAHDEVGTLLLSDVLTSSSLVEFTFATWDGASEEALVEFAYDVATACTFVAGDLTNPAVIELVDRNGCVAKRILPRPVESPFIGRRLIPDDDIPRFFADCFEAHRRMRRDDRWRKLASYCGTVEACATLEQRFASVAIALEFVMRNSLIQAGQPTAAVENLELGPLIGRARKVLGWPIPSHYTKNDRWRRLRNAVAHGNERDVDLAAGNTEFRQEFDKLKLLLFRLSLLQLGYGGQVLAPGEHGYHPSAIHDFSEDRNTFRHGEE